MEPSQLELRSVEDVERTADSGWLHGVRVAAIGFDCVGLPTARSLTKKPKSSARSRFKCLRQHSMSGE